MRRITIIAVHHKLQWRDTDAGHLESILAKILEGDPTIELIAEEANKSLIVLYDLISLGLGESLSGRQPGESNIVAIDCWNLHGGRAPRRSSEEAFVEAITMENDGDKGIRSNANAEISLDSRSVGRPFCWVPLKQACVGSGWCHPNSMPFSQQHGRGIH